MRANVHLAMGNSIDPIRFGQGAAEYVATAFPFAARNTAYERPFIVSTAKLTGAPFMVSELN